MKCFQCFLGSLTTRDKKKAEKEQRYAEKAVSHYGKLSFRVAQSIGQWRLKNHAVDDFWRWVASWAKALRMPSDMGFSDDGFMLPELIERTHIVKADTPPEGFLFCVPAFGLAEEREERKRTINERCEMAAKLCDHEKPAVIWCHTNAEGDLLEKIIPGARQIAGRTPNEEKLEIYDDFVSGKLRVIVIKPKIGAWGLNWQHCAHVITFASHSFEQHYQSIRRCWRFGQKNKVIVDIIATEGESRVLANLERKSNQAEVMFTKLIQEMNNSVKITTKNEYTKKRGDTIMAIKDQITKDNYAIYCGDCCEVMQSLPDKSIDLSVYSPPFAGLYVYSSDPRDMSNCINRDEFFKHYEVLCKTDCAV